MLADVDSIESQLPKRQKMARADKSLAPEVAAMEAALEVLSGGTPLYRSGLADDLRAGLRSTFLLTDKPMLAVVNLGEDQLDDADRLVKPVAEELGDAAEVLGVSVQLEAESARLDPADRAEMLDALGWAKGPCPASSGPPTTCSAGARSSPPATRSRGRGRSGPGPRPPSAPASSTPTCSGASSGPRSSGGTSCSSSARGTRPRRSDASGSRARTTRSPTATSLEIRFNV